MSLSRACTVLILGIFVSLSLAACDDIVSEDDEELQPDPEAEVTTQEFTAEEVQAAREYWTPERMEAAVPVDVGLSEAPPAPVSPTIPHPDEDEVVREGDSPRVDGIERLPGSDSKLMEQSAPSSAQEVQDHAAYPNRAVGKVFFSKSSGGDFVCSASVIAAENRSVVWTAGHCLAEGGDEEWHENFLFVPAYEEGDEPAGRWAARTLATFVGWYSNRNFHYDLGAAVVEQQDGNSLVDVTGSLGWMFNASHDTDTWQFGYPSAGSIFDGQTMWRCEEPYDGAYDHGNNSGPSMQTNDCDYTAGSSGGPWVVNFDECPSCYTNSVNSLWWSSDSGDLGLQWAGPYHGRAAHNLLQVAESL